MSAVFPAAVDAFLGGAIDIDTDTIKAQLTEGYVYSAAHSTLADVGAGTRLDAAVTLSSVSISGGAVTVDPVTFPAVTTGHTIDGIIIYQDSGAGEANQLIAHIDRLADRVPISIDTDGSAETFSWTTLLSL